MTVRKNRTFEDRVSENGMMYRQGNKVKIHSLSELMNSGLSTREARAIKHLCGRTLTIRVLLHDKQLYVLSETSTPVCDADIKCMVLG